MSPTSCSYITLAEQRRYEVASRFGKNLRGDTERGKETYFFKCTIYHAFIKYSSGFSPEL